MPRSGYDRNEEIMNLDVGESMDITPMKDGGAILKRLRHGTGTEYPTRGDKVTLKYIGYRGNEIRDDCIFDSSETDGKLYQYDCLRGLLFMSHALV